MSAERIAREAGVIRDEAIEQTVKQLEHSVAVLHSLSEEATQLPNGEDKFRALHELMKARRTVEAFQVLEQRRRGSASRYRQELEGARQQLVAAGGSGCLLVSFGFAAALTSLAAFACRVARS